MKQIIGINGDVRSLLWIVLMSVDLSVTDLAIAGKQRITQEK
jgi:hypothetical protein